MGKRDSHRPENTGRARVRSRPAGPEGRSPAAVGGERLTLLAAKVYICILLNSLQVVAMPFFDFFWNTEIVDHLAEHDVSPGDFEQVVQSAALRGQSRSSGRPCCWGETADGRYLLCVYEYIDEVTIFPITAFEVRRPRR